MTAHEEARAWLAEMDDLVKRNGAAGDQALLKQERVARDVVRALLAPPADEEREAFRQAVSNLERDYAMGEYSGGGYRYIEATPEALRIVLDTIAKHRDRTVTDEMAHAADLARLATQLGVTNDVERWTAERDQPPQTGEQ